MSNRLTPSQIETIINHCEPVVGLLEVVEQTLRDTQQTDLADRLCRLIIDIGLEQDPTFEPNPADRPEAPGPQTAAMWQAYTPVTTSRVQATFATVVEHLADAAQKSKLSSLLALLNLNAPSSSLPSTEHQSPAP